MVVSADYAFKYKTSGVELNGNNSVPVPGAPVYDIYKVSGLDFPPIQQSAKTFDGMHGGFVEAQYTNIRTVVLNGVLMCHTSDSLETYLDALKTNFSPVATEDYLYFKAPGAVERKLGCKPTGFTYDWDQARRYNSCTFQIILQAQDPVCYGLTHHTQAIGNNVGLTIPNAGNAPVPAKFTINNAGTNLHTNAIFYKSASDDAIQMTLSVAATDRFVVDLRTHQVYTQNTSTLVITDRRAAVTREEWWLLDPVGTLIVVATATGTPTISIEWDDGWW